ncbi:MAG: SusD/RagB family nutrient-binding outer membrane lipoprotein [Bacteroidetes bacterium QH_2_63_10]|nr:MAG: SusD/RagB family nutrient-binding outer membrane lipoprotein [Bacteroidetes bacterium QH_2_63_10]
MKRYATLSSLFAGLFASLLVLGGCDNLSSYNDNPNQPTSADPNNLLANGQKELADEVYGGTSMMRRTNVWAQYTTQNFYPSESRYATVDYEWGGMYSPLNDLEQAKKFAVSPNTEAIATITQVWALQILTDTYGDIPLDAALQGAANKSPSYTAQPDVYTALLDSLNTAISTIDASQPSPSGDLIHGGDMTKWQRFANGLKMRIGLRLLSKNASRAEQAITSANGNALQSNADNTYFQFGTSSTHRNDYYENREVSFRDDFDGSARFINAMQQYDAADDPRLDAYFEQTSDTNRPCEDGSGEYQGFPFGLEQGDAQNKYSSTKTCEFSRPESWWSGGPSGEGDAYAPMMYYDEVLLTKAEAAERGIISGNPEDLIADAIEASVDFYGDEVPGASISSSSTQTQDYIDAVLSDYNANGFEQVIGEQRWIAFYMNNVQGWATFRRLDFSGWIGSPSGGVAAEFGSYVPLRVDYPDSEYSLNEENVTGAAESQFGSVDQETPGRLLWWDVNDPPANPY